MNDSASPGNVSQTGAQAASAIKSARMITRAEQFQFESHFDSAATSGAGAQAADFSESWDSADTGKPESSDIGGDGVNELTSERDTRVSEQRQRDSQGGSDDAKSGDDSDTPTFPLHLDAIASQAFVHPFQLLAGVVSGSALTANLQAEQPRASACWSQLSEGVNRLLVNTDPHALNAPAAVLKLDSSLLPNTTLTLARVPEGWVLQVHSQAFEVRRALRAHADELQERFARLSLGQLRVEAVENTSDDLFL